jgi:polar amino acid transport system substrate-binding protein
MKLTLRTLHTHVVVTVGALALVGVGCSAAATPSPSASPTNPSTAAPATAAPSADSCAKASLTLHTPGKLTIGTDNPAFGPWFGGTPAKGSPWQVSDPTSGEGLESAVAYAIADKLGFDKAEVAWVAVPFNNVIQPGPKAFDFDVNQVSYSSERAKAVDMSDGYFDDNQAVVAFKDRPIAKATSVADLKAYRLGAQIGTTSYAYITDNIKPTVQPRVYNTTDAAIKGLQAKQIDGIVVDLGTAFYMRDAQLTNGTIVGSLPTVGAQEHFSAVLNKGSPLTTCVNAAIGALKADGTLDALRKQWIESKGSVPVLQ